MTDYISRADAIDAVMAEGRNVYTSEYANAERIIHEADAVEALSMLPSAEPKFVHIETYRDLYEKYMELKHKSAEYEEADGVITIEKQSAKDVGDIKHIVIHSPNYTRYFYNESMPLPAEAEPSPKDMLDGTVLISQHDWIEMQKKLEKCASAEVVHKPDYSYEADMVRRYRRDRGGAGIMTKKFYIAGPITGADQVDIQLSFYRMERILLDSGHKAYNPAALPKGLDWGTYMQIAVAVLCSGQIDGIIMLDGWQKSKGAQIERLAAQAIGIPIFYEDDKLILEKIKEISLDDFADRSTGSWISEIDTGTWMLKCSVCGCRVQEEKYRVAVGEAATKCPYCGSELGQGGYLYDEYADRPSQRGDGDEA